MLLHQLGDRTGLIAVFADRNDPSRDVHAHLLLRGK
jgi:hypothetical protein